MCRLIYLLMMFLAASGCKSSGPTFSEDDRAAMIAAAQALSKLEAPGDAIDARYVLRLKEIGEKCGDPAFVEMLDASITLDRMKYEDSLRRQPLGVATKYHVADRFGQRWGSFIALLKQGEPCKAVGALPK